MYIHLDSRNRDQTRFPWSNSFVMDLYTPVKNIAACRILTASVPQGPTTDPYLFVDIEELRSAQVVDVPAVTIVSNVTTPSGLTTNKYVGIIPNNGQLYSTASSYELKVTYDTPIDKLSRFTVKITDFTGKPVNIGTSNVSLVLDLDCLPEGKPIERSELPEPIVRPVISRPAVQIPNKLLLIGLGILAFLIILLVPKLKRRPQ